MANQVAVPILVRSLRRPAWRGRLWVLARRQPLGTAAAVIIAILVVVAIFPGQIATSDPLVVHRGHRLEGPSSEFLAGTDDIGRDVFSRLVFGTRVSLTAGILSVAFGVLSGSAIGLLSAYVGGTTDFIIQRFMDTLMAFPGLVLAMALAAVYEPGLSTAVIAISLILAPQASRVIRGVTLSLRESQYIEAARTVGAGHTRILLRHLLPNVAAPIIILSSVVMATAIIIEASLGFLGLGVQAPEPSWGGMLSSSGRRFFEQAPWLVIAPGLAISITVMAFNFFGDALRDMLDPSLRGKR